MVFLVLRKKEHHLKRTIIKDTFKINKNPYAFRKGFGAAISASLPIFIGILLGDFQSGLTAGIGGFSYLYVFNEPYKHRAKKVFFVMLGLAAAMGFGTLTAGSPVLFGILLGLMGAVITFIFGALKIRGPASIFFIIIFAMTSAMDINPDDALRRAILVFLGGTVSWIVATIGWFSNPYRPEKKAIQRIYANLANLLASVNSPKFNELKHDTLLALKDVESTLTSGYISWRSTEDFKRLYLLKENAHELWASILEIEAADIQGVPPDIIEFLRNVGQSINKKSTNITVPSLDNLGVFENRMLKKIVEAKDVIEKDNYPLDKEIHLLKQPLLKIFADAFDKNSVVLLTSIRYGVILGIATLIAFSFNFDRSYWIPVSCGAVMLGSTIIATFHRALQRSIGTVVGIILAILILSLRPEPILVALLVASFNFLTETFIVRNYALAATFLTPNAILIAESTTQIGDIAFFANARLTDTIIGSLIGVLGVLLVGRKSASSRLPHFMSKTIRSQSQLFFQIFTGNQSKAKRGESSSINKMRTNLNNLRTVYSTALGEIPNNLDYLSLLSPAIYSIERLGYFLVQSLNQRKNTNLSKEELAQFLLIFETLAQSIEQGELLEVYQLPLLSQNQRIYEEIKNLQELIILIYNLPKE